MIKQLPSLYKLQQKIYCGNDSSIYTFSCEVTQLHALWVQKDKIRQKEKYKFLLKSMENSLFNEPMA